MDSCLNGFFPTPTGFRPRIHSAQKMCLGAKSSPFVKLTAMPGVKRLKCWTPPSVGKGTGKWKLQILQKLSEAQAGVFPLTKSITLCVIHQNQRCGNI